MLALFSSSAALAKLNALKADETPPNAYETKLNALKADETPPNAYETKLNTSEQIV